MNNSAVSEVDHAGPFPLHDLAASFAALQQSVEELSQSMQALLQSAQDMLQNMQALLEASRVAVQGAASAAAGVHSNPDVGGIKSKRRRRITTRRLGGGSSGVIYADYSGRSSEVISGSEVDGE